MCVCLYLSSVYHLCLSLVFMFSLPLSVLRNWFMWLWVKMLVFQSCPILCNPMDCSPPCSSVYGDSPGKNTGVSCHSLLQGVFPTQGSNPSLLHCRQSLFHLSYQESTYVVVETGKSKLHRVDWPAGDPGRSWCQSSSLKSVCHQIPLSLGESQSLFIKVFTWQKEAHSHCAG